jgi:tetratricopeptide (TPR) repeat protein
MSDYYDFLTHYLPLAIRMKNPNLLGAFYARLGQCEYTFGLFDKSIENATKALRLCEASGNAEDAVYACMVLEFCHLFKGNFDEVLTLREEVLGKMEDQFDIYAYCRAICAASLAYSFLGRWDEAVEEGQKALSVARELSNRIHISFAAVMISAAYIFKNDLTRGLQYGTLAFENATTFADRTWSKGILGWLRSQGADPNEGMEDLASMVQSARYGRNVPTELLFTPHLAEAYCLAGEYDKAHQMIEELIALAERCRARLSIGWAYRVLGEITLKTNPDESAPHFEKAISILREIKAENELALAYSGMGRYHKQQRNMEQAREYLTKALEIFEGLGTLIEPDKVRKELADLPQ